MRMKGYSEGQVGSDWHEWSFYEKLMEEMANAPREPYIRQPGERQTREIYRND